MPGVRSKSYLDWKDCWIARADSYASSFRTECSHWGTCRILMLMRLLMAPTKSNFRNKAEGKSLGLSAMEAISQPMEPEMEMARIRVKARTARTVRTTGPASTERTQQLWRRVHFRKLRASSSFKRTSMEYQQKRLNWPKFSWTSQLPIAVRSRGLYTIKKRIHCSLESWSARGEKSPVWPRSWLAM